MPRWKISQEVFIKIHYFDRNVNSLTAFTKRKPKAIYERARKLGLKKVPNWTNVEIASLLANGAKKTSEIYKRSYNSCLIKKHRLCKSHKN
jgi:hypothetical protein